MGENQHYLFLSSLDSQLVHPSNKADDFIVELPHPLHLTGIWECALVDMQLSRSQNSSLVFYVCCDLCEDSYVNNTQLPVLRSLSSKAKTFTQFSQPQYMRVKRDRVTRLRVFIRSWSDIDLSLAKELVTCTLHLRRRA